MKDTEGQGQMELSVSFMLKTHSSSQNIIGLYSFLVVFSLWLSLNFPFRERGISNHILGSVLRPWRDHQFYQICSMGKISL